MKKIFCLVLVLLVVLSYFNISLYSKNKELKIAMILWRGETKAEKGFKKGLKELGYTVKYSIFNADQKKKKLVKILKTEIESKINDFDYIYSFGTTASLATKLQIQNRIPHIFNIVSFPVKAGIVKSIKLSGENISGVSNNISLRVQIKTALEVFSFKKIGFFFNPKERNAEIIYRKLKNIAKDFNFKLVEFQCSPESKHLENKLQKIISKSIIIDAVYLPMDSYVISNSLLIGEQLRIAKIISAPPRTTRIIRSKLPSFLFIFIPS